MHEVILSVGIDIGTSTTQLIFSRLTIENRASSYTVPRIDIVDKEVIYRSKIYFTPLRSATEIDAEAVKRIVREEYQAAGMTPEMFRNGFRFNLLVNDNDGEGRDGWIHIAPGIGDSKNPDKFPFVVFE